MTIVILDFLNVMMAIMKMETDAAANVQLKMGISVLEEMMTKEIYV